MKHAFWDRLLIILCSLLLLGVAALLLGMVIGFLPASLLAEKIGQLMSNRSWRVIAIAAAIVLVVLACFVFWIVLPRRKGRSSTFAIQQTEHGALKISVKALDHLVQKCISQHPELSIVSSSIHSDEDTVQVDLRVTLQSDINIPLAISSLQKQIKQYVEACSGVDVDEVRVVVESTVPPVSGTNSPYAIPDMLQPQLPKKLPEGALSQADFVEQEPSQQPILSKESEFPKEPEPPQAPEPPLREDVLPLHDDDWMQTKPIDLGEEPEPIQEHKHEPMPSWLLEREPSEHASTDVLYDASGEELETEGGRHTEEGE